MDLPFASNLQRRRVWSVARTSLNVKVKGQGHQGQKERKTAESSPLTMRSKACAVRRTLHAAADDTIASQPRGVGVTAAHADGGLHAVYVW